MFILEKIMIRALTVRITVIKQTLLSPLGCVFVRLVLLAVSLRYLRQLAKLFGDALRSTVHVVIFHSITIPITLTVLLIQLYS
jgi:hypothetical protein